MACTEKRMEPLAPERAWPYGAAEAAPLKSLLIKLATNH